MKLGNTELSGAQSVFFLLGALAVFFSLFPEASKQGFLWLNQAGRAFPDTPLALITNLGNGVIAACLWVTLLCFRPSVLWKALGAIALSALIINAMKQGLDVMRPAAVLDDIRIVGAMRLNHSLPSAHTGTVFALAGIAWSLCRRADLKAIILLGAVLVGLSRVTNGAHWPLDIVMGAWLGWGCARLAWRYVPDCRLSARTSMLVLGALYLALLISALQAKAPFPQLPLVDLQLKLMLLSPLFGLYRLYTNVRAEAAGKKKVSLAG